MSPDITDFLTDLARSGLLSAEDIHQFYQQLYEDQLVQDLPTTAREFADRFVSAQKLTPFQAERLLEGAWQGLVLGNVVLRERIGEGGMGEVFLAEHRRMKRPVVVKVLPPEATRSDTLIKRFQREVEAAARLVHPNIVTAYDADEIDGIYFMVMEYVEGQDLASLVDKHGPIQLETALSYIIQAARGLHYAHTMGIIHRDIKPSNLLVDGSNTIKILDMGLARLNSRMYHIDEEQDSLTEQDNILGTVEYMSPEQADDSSEVDHRTDIYSLGCTLYRLLTGVPPFKRETSLKTLMAHRTAPIPRLSNMRSDVGEELENIYQRMVAKLPQDRFPSVQHVLDELETCLEETDFHVGTGSFYGPLTPQPTTSRRRGNQDHTAVLVKEETEGPEPRPARRRRSRSPAVGIDLGTTFSAMSYLDDLGRPQTITNSDGEKVTPSMVLFDGDEVVVGKEAVRAMPTHLESIAAFPKRDVGSPTYHRPIQGKLYPPEVLVAWVLRALATNARQQIGDFSQVVITVPAYFDEVRRKATQDAGYMAGLEVIDIINEPTAAALAFGYQQGFLRPGGSGNKSSKVMIYDLGGGTFDVTIMEIQGTEFRTLATDGDIRLGGLDWDQRLIDFVADEFLQLHGIDPRMSPNSLGRLWRDCEEAKRTLSTRTRTHVVCQHEGQVCSVPVTREKFQQLTSDLLDRTIFTARQTLKTCSLDWSDLDHVLLVGGSTRMPAVRVVIRELWGKEPDVSVSPDEAVAHGAALHAQLVLARHGGLTPTFQIANVNSHSLGVVATDPATRITQNAVLIPRNTRLPAKTHRIFLTQKEDQRSILVQIVEGESRDPAECSQVGKCVVRDLPGKLPRHTPIDMHFKYEENGRLTVSVRLPKTKKRIKQHISRENSLSREQRSQWRAVVTGEPTKDAHELA